MFSPVPEPIKQCMEYLENLDARHRAQEIDHLQRLRQIPPVTGRFLALLAASAPQGTYLEIGTSGGYSGLWISLACRLLKRRLTTFEILPDKAQIAKETFTKAGVDDIIELIIGDARDFLENYRDVSFCFLDAEKDVYQICYDILIPSMITGGLFVADNVISHKDILQGFVDHAIHDSRVDALVIPIGSGELLCRKT